MTIISNNVRKSYINKRKYCLKNIDDWSLRLFTSSCTCEEDSAVQADMLTLTSRVGVTNVRQGFSMPP